jgi:hypothetical protein
MDFPFDANASGEFFDALETIADEDQQFAVNVPPHIRPEAIAHWDTNELW